MVEVMGGSGGALTLRPSGELCHFGVEPLSAAIDAAIRTARFEIRVDLAEVTLVSSAAVHVFQRAARECERRNLRFALCGADGLRLRVLELLGAGDLHWETAST